MPAEHVDVLIIGAGISGVAAACHLSRQCPGKSYAILERRRADRWHLGPVPLPRASARTPTCTRSASTSGRGPNPRCSPTAPASGATWPRRRPSTASTEHITFGRRVVTASWSTGAGRWSVESVDEATGETQRMTATVLVSCTGYYDYDNGYRPEFPGEERFDGPIVHPQHWPEDLDYAGKKVVIIGSGATAVTLVPAMAGEAAHVTMLQRSPTYIVSLPAVDKISQALAPRAARQRGLQARPRAQHRHPAGDLRAGPGAAQRRALDGAQGRATPARRLVRPRELHPRIRPVGPAAVRRARRRPVPRACARARPTSSPTRSRPSPRPASSSSPGEVLEADIIVTATGLQVQMLGGTRGRHRRRAARPSTGP